MTARLTRERIAEIRSYTTDKSGNRWWSEFGMGDALVFVEELLAEVEALAAEADRLLDERRVFHDLRLSMSPASDPSELGPRCA